MANKKSVLIIEDEKSLSGALKLKLTKLGVDISIANNGEDGLKMAKEKAFDLILCDLVMPKMDGFKFLQEYKTVGKSPVMVLSNLGQAEDEQKARQLGAVDFFIKANTSLAAITKAVSSKLGIESK